jgi:hypothetical protein
MASLQKLKCRLYPGTQICIGLKNGFPSEASAEGKPFAKASCVKDI